MSVDINKVKIVVTVPTENLKQVRDAMCEAGAGIIGNYSHCTTTTKSVGTFMPNEKASPYIGKTNKLEYVEEEKIEAVCNIDNVKNVLTKLRQAHPYEEPAIDIIPLLDEKNFN